MSERPFMQLYVSDFLGDTLALSTEQIGAYLLLLMAMWNAKGTLPDDDAKLARIVRMSVKKWRSISPELMVYFDRFEGIVSHHRLTFEIEKSERQSESRASAGARGGAATALKNNKQRPASAAAKQVAKPQHLPEPYRKEGATRSDPTDGLARVDKHLEPELFSVLVALKPDDVRSWAEHWSWPAKLVAETRARLAGKVAA